MSPTRQTTVARPAKAPGTVAPRSRARRGEGDRLRDEILDAAEALLAEKGHPDAVSMRAIAKRVGVSPPAIYLHFEDKQQLFYQCCARGFAALTEVMEQAAADATSDFERLEALGRAYIRFGLSHGEQYRVMFPNVVAADVRQVDLENGIRA